MHPDRSSAPQLHNAPALVIPSPEISRLDNGATIKDLNIGELPVNRLTFCWKGGVTDISNPSALTIATQLLCEGSARFTGEMISNTLDFNGAWVKADPMQHFLTVTLHSLNKTFPDVFPVFSDLMLYPDFPETEFEAIREKVASALEINLKNVSFLAANENLKLVFGEKHPLACIQTPDDIRRCTCDDVREFYESIVRGNAPYIYICGDSAEPVSIVRSQFGDVEFTGSKTVSEIIPMSPSYGAFSKVTVADAKQSGINISIPTINRSHPDYIDLRLAITALGGYFGSRLMRNIREDKGYTYGIRANLLGYLEGGMVNIVTDTDRKYVDAVIEETKKEIERLSSIPMEEEELTTLKNIAFSSLYATLDTPFNMMDYHFILDTQHISSGYFQRQVDAINSLTSQKIMELMKKHIDISKMITAVAGA